MRTAMKEAHDIQNCCGVCFFYCHGMGSQIPFWALESLSFFPLT